MSTKGADTSMVSELQAEVPGELEPAELPGAYKHATYSAYIGAKCRCRACKDAHAAYQREWRARQKRAEREAAERQDGGGL
jgi:hypothetical protein